MRTVDAQEVTKTVSRLFQDACYYLPDDVAKEALRLAQYKLSVKTKIIERPSTSGAE